MCSNGWLRHSTRLDESFQCPKKYRINGQPTHNPLPNDHVIKLLLTYLPETSRSICWGVMNVSPSIGSWHQGTRFQRWFHRAKHNDKSKKWLPPKGAEHIVKMQIFLRSLRTTKTSERKYNIWHIRMHNGNIHSSNHHQNHSTVRICNDDN